MRCPFCAEEIKDAAVRCRYCGGSVHVVLALQNQVSELESQLANRELAPIRGGQASETISDQPLQWGKTLLIVAFWSSVIPTYVFFLNPHGSALMLASFAAYPAALGFWLGVRRLNQNLRLYIISGAIAGILGNFEIAIFEWGLYFNALDVRKFSDYFTLTQTLLFLVGSILLCASAGVIGSWLKRRRSNGSQRLCCTTQA